ncbi:MAG: hypothetical protein Q9210_005547 [Variospora velana]
MAQGLIPLILHALLPHLERPIIGAAIVDDLRDDKRTEIMYLRTSSRVAVRKEFDSLLSAGWEITTH